MEEPDNQEIKRDTLGRFVKGFSGHPEGRPKGKTLKEWAKDKMMEMTDEERNEFLKGLPKEIIWKMAEGNPHNTEDLTSKGEKIFVLPSELINKNGIRTNESTKSDSAGQP